MKRPPLPTTIALTIALSASLPAITHANDLPSLGDSSSALVSLSDEYQLGRSWLRQLRASADIIDDPIMTEFLENLTYRLLPHANAPQTDLEFVAINQQELNAFAVPGGIIGVHFGLLLYTRDEDELSSVLAHELAHLSQRHFARRAEVSERNGPLALAAFLASILVAATVDAEAGIAGIMAAQGAAIQNQLAYSRDWEREADRIGITTMIKAGLDPHAMPDMFQQMLEAARYYRKPPEFLLTHPLTTQRIADAEDRSQPYPVRQRARSFNFGILRNNAFRAYRLKEDQQVLYFSDLLSRAAHQSYEQSIHRYTLAAIALDHGDPAEAMTHLQQISKEWQHEPAALSLKARVLAASGHTDDGLQQLKSALPWHPNSYVLHSTYAALLEASEHYETALSVMKQLNQQRPTNPAIWRRIAELAKKNKQTLLSYHANAEYLFLTGDSNRSAQQMDMAILQATRDGDFQRREALRERLVVMTEADKNRHR